MVQMGYRKNNLNHLSMFVFHHRMVLTSAELTAIIGTLQNLHTYLFPILRISILILSLNWHSRIFLHSELKFLHARVFLSALLLWLVMHTPFTLRKETGTPVSRDFL